MQPESVLSILHRHKGGHVSGQEMAGRLGITRAAVWKAVESLRADGYAIESLKAKGYSLVFEPDILGVREIGLGLGARTLGRRIYSLDRVDSTNSFASKLASAGEPEGTLVVSETQSAGRGRLGRRWVSPPGMNIYMSLVMRPAFPPADAPLTTLAASVSLSRSVRALYGLDAAIKWPNDMLISGKKAAGILTEMSAEPDSIRHVILGVGVDVNMPLSALPREIRGISTSVMLELGEKVNRAPLVRAFLEDFEGVYGLLLAGKKKEVLDAWREHSCTLGREVRVVSLSGSVSGLARDIDEDGSLLLARTGGRLERVSCGDLEFP